MAGDPVLAIDIGGTKLAVGVVARDGTVRRSNRTATSVTDGEALWRRLGGLVDEVLAGASPSAVGIGCGGPLRLADGLVSPLNIPGWRDFPLVERLRARFPDVPIRLRNDAVAMAVGEHWRGAGRGTTSMLGVVVSTGVGGGLAVGAGDLLFDPIRDAFTRHAHMGFARSCEVVSAALGADAGVVGAAALVIEPRYIEASGADS